MCIHREKRYCLANVVQTPTGVDTQQKSMTSSQEWDERAFPTHRCLIRVIFLREVVKLLIKRSKRVNLHAFAFAEL